MGIAFLFAETIQRSKMGTPIFWKPPNMKGEYDGIPINCVVMMMMMMMMTMMMMMMMMIQMCWGDSMEKYVGVLSVELL